MIRNSGSFRDPSGFVFSEQGKIYRALNDQGLNQYNDLKESGLLAKLHHKKWLVDSTFIDKSQFKLLANETKAVLAHQTIPFISYPFEWPFALLKKAALFYLDISIYALQFNMSLNDASAYNIQFIGAKPIYIDVLSFQKYQKGQYWTGHKQFCEQFLIPLLFKSKLNLSANAIYRGNLEGISREFLIKSLPFFYRFSWPMLMHIYLPEYFQKKYAKKESQLIKKQIKKNQLSKDAYLGMLKGLKRWIEKLSPTKSKHSLWLNYEINNSYDEISKKEKQQFITTFIQSTKPKLLFDLGCNQGQYANVALNADCKMVVGFDNCFDTLDKAVEMSEKKALPFLPLYSDLTNPSPNLGWQEKERDGFHKRVNGNALIALAIIHHLRLSKNIPLAQIVAWLVSIAPYGVIEFVGKKSSVMEKMLSFREDVFSDYNQTNFEKLLKNLATIKNKCILSSDDRTLYWYQRL